MNYLIIGAGLAGLTIARLLTDKGHTVTILESSDHIGGALKTETIDGVEVHSHGPHIFHTDYVDVINFVNRFTTWYTYYHRVQAAIPLTLFPELEPKLVELPLSYKSLADFYGTYETQYLEFVSSNSSSRMKHPVKEIDNLIGSIGWDMYEYVIRPYSEKQWGRSMENIPLNVIDRLGKFRKGEFKSGYFEDRFQALPKSYSSFIECLSYGLNIKLNTTLDKSDINKYTKVIYTGSIDELFDYELGDLEYRSLGWDKLIDGDIWEVDPVTYDLPVLNLPLHPVYTRYVFHHNFIPSRRKSRYITGEYSFEWSKGKKPMRYYPIGDKKNSDLFNEYMKLSKSRYPNIDYIGRLGTYKYMDMDDVIKQCMNYLYEATNI